MLAVIFLLLNAQFLFAVQLIIYAGAVMVLFVLIVALLSPDAEDRPALDLRAIIGGAGVALVTVLVFIVRNGITYNTAGFHATSVGSASNPYHTFSFPADTVNAAGNVQTVAGQLFTDYVLPFEITSIVLLVAVDSRGLPDPAARGRERGHGEHRTQPFPTCLGFSAFLFTRRCGRRSDQAQSARGFYVHRVDAECRRTSPSLLWPLPQQ